VFDRAKIPGWGLFDGQPGSKTQLLVKRSGDENFRTFAEVFGKISPTKFTNVIVSRGDLILYQTPGGGGFGDPWTRDPHRVLEDVAEGLVSPAVVGEQYGVVLRQIEDGYTLDEAATKVLRSERVS
jgi:N-methylhydantoinase B